MWDPASRHGMAALPARSVLSVLLEAHGLAVEAMRPAASERRAAGGGGRFPALPADSVEPARKYGGPSGSGKARNAAAALRRAGGADVNATRTGR
jgi:hypothetical protein